MNAEQNNKLARILQEWSASGNPDKWEAGMSEWSAWSGWTRESRDDRDYLYPRENEAEDSGMPYGYNERSVMFYNQDDYDLWPYDDPTVDLAQERADAEWEARPDYEELIAMEDGGLRDEWLS